MTDIGRIVSETERQWRRAGVPAATIREMKAELESHLREAEREGKSLDAVVGPDLKSFAAAWASEQGAGGSSPDPPRRPRARAAGLTGLALAAGAVVVLALVFGEKVPDEEVEAWRWIWVGAAVVLG
ncbi:MAG TPA: hypothetical protein VIL12_05450, partial [Acidimicrobiia bacterium]